MERNVIMGVAIMMAVIFFARFSQDGNALVKLDSHQIAEKLAKTAFSSLL